MEEFKYRLANGAAVTGIYSIPHSNTNAPKRKPLIVGIHGGGYNCDYFDGDEKHTALISSNAYGIPFVAIDRPCYGGTTSLLPLPEGSTFPHETGVWLHSYILPTLWKEIGLKNDCNCIVLLCHSMGVMGGTAAAALHAQDNEPLYPLGGLIASGLGHQQNPAVAANKIEPNLPDDHFKFPVAVKDHVMFAPGTVDLAILQQSERLNHAAPLAEFRSLGDIWILHWRETWAAKVESPVLFAFAEIEPFFAGTEEHLQECAQAFSKSSHVEQTLVPKAPHCMELSHWSSSWYARCFGFAMQCAASYML